MTNDKAKNNDDYVHFFEYVHFGLAAAVVMRSLL